MGKTYFTIMNLITELKSIVPKEDCIVKNLLEIANPICCRGIIDRK